MVKDCTWGISDGLFGRLSVDEIALVPDESVPCNGLIADPSLSWCMASLCPHTLLPMPRPTSQHLGGSHYIWRRSGNSQRSPSQGELGEVKKFLIERVQEPGLSVGLFDGMFYGQYWSHVLCLLDRTQHAVASVPAAPWATW